MCSESTWLANQHAYDKKEPMRVGARHTLKHDLEGFWQKHKQKKGKWDNGKPIYCIFY